MIISIIGSGNVATVLAKKLQDAGHQLKQVYSRNPEHAETLARKHSASAVRAVEELDDADVFIVAVSDAALLRIRDWMKPVKGLIVHTAGSVSIRVLEGLSSSYGVLYPLQSLRKSARYLPDIPFLIDGNSDNSLTEITGLAASISSQVEICNDEKRIKLHLAAVISNNFSNHLFALTEEFCHREGADFRLLLPLLSETVKRLEEGNIFSMQTGPAIRNDTDTMTKQMKLLEDYPALRKLYEVFSENIIGLNTGHKKAADV